MWTLVTEICIVYPLETATNTLIFGTMSIGACVRAGILCVCVCVCVRARARARVCVFVYVYVRACTRLGFFNFYFAVVLLFVLPPELKSISSTSAK